MSKQGIAVRTTNVTIANACLEIIAPANNSLRITEINIDMAGPAGGTFGIGRPAAAGITPTSPVSLILDDSGDQGAGGTAVLGTVATAWGTGPTVPAAFMYRLTLSGQVGAAKSVSIPEGIVIPAGTTLVIWNISTTDVADITVKNSTKPLAQTLANF